MVMPSRNVVAVLGPTNTGKTHLAIERMLAHSSGVIGLPLRLLAREVYDKVAARIGPDKVALITGEEKILPPNPSYRICTVEALPSQTDASFLAIDEIQLAGDLERGHIFTDRILNLRGRDETLLLGAATMRGIVEKLVPGVNVVTRPRMSVLAYNGAKKITRLPRRSAIVAFSADEVYAIAELIRRQRGGAAVVLGALSPRTRNAQVELFQSGDVDFLVATDAIGMGLNLDLEHVAFASDRKFDGYQYRKLTAAELGQIAGRAGRHLRDGTFGVTGRAAPLDEALVEALESHRFDPIKTVQWRNRELDFSSLANLRQSLDLLPKGEGLVKAPPAEDVNVLDLARRDDDITRLAGTASRVKLLWDICQIPDYRRIALANHADLVMTLFQYLARDGMVDTDWFAGQVAFSDRMEGDIDTLANRIAHIRTWTFIANRPQWLADPIEWQEKTRAIEDRLSDALHERLTQRFVDRRTSVLMRRLRENVMLETEVTSSGDVIVEGQHVGLLRGFRFDPDPNAAGPDGKAIRAAAQKALAGEIEKRADSVAAAPQTDFILAADGVLRWRGEAIAQLTQGDLALRPRVLLLADESLTGPARDRVQSRADLWLAGHLESLLKPLFELTAAVELTAPARGLAFRLVENLGVIDRAAVAGEVKAFDQAMRSSLRRIGVRFGAYHIYLPALLKPAPARMLAMLWGLRNSGLETPGLAELAQLVSSGRTTIAVDSSFPAELYRIMGYRIAGPRAVRIDILERLADLIRPALAWRAGLAADQTPPAGVVDGRCFTVTVAMTSLLGCAGEDFAAILRSISYRMERRAPLPKPEPAAATADAAVAPNPPLEGTTPVEETDSVSDEFDPVIEEAPAKEGIPGQAPLPAADSPAPTDDVPQAPTSSAISNETAEPSAFIEVWRPARRERAPKRAEAGAREARPRRERRAAQPPAAAPDKPVDDAPPGPRRHRRPDARPLSKPNRNPSSGEQRQAAPPRERDRAPDPNSPFAALAALKAEMERRRQD